MKPLRAHTPTIRAKTKLAALVAAALLAATSAGSAELTQEARDTDNAVLVALGTQPKGAGGSIAVEEGEEWEGAEELECSGCGNGVGLRGQVLATSNPNKAIEIGDHEGLLGTYTPLTAAAEMGSAKDIKALLARGANVNLRDPDGYTPLLRARGAENIKVLLDNGADVNATSAWGDTALSRAYQDDVHVLQAAGAKKNPIADGASDALGNTALMLAARSGDTKEMQRLIDAGADVNAANQAGNTALMIAAHSNQTGSAKLLLDKGANANAANGKGETALMHVHDVNMAKLLLKKGANVHARDKNGMTALDRAQGDAEAYGGDGTSPMVTVLKNAAKKSSGKRK